MPERLVYPEHEGREMGVSSLWFKHIFSGTLRNNAPGVHLQNCLRQQIQLLKGMRDENQRDPLCLQPL